MPVFTPYRIGSGKSPRNARRLGRFSWYTRARARCTTLIGVLPSAPRPAGRALVEKRRDALLKIGAIVTQADDVVAAVGGEQTVDDAADAFLAGAEGQRRRGRDGLGELLGPRFEEFRRYDLVHQSPRERLTRLDEPRGENHLLRARRADQGHHAGVVVHREA